MAPPFKSLMFLLILAIQEFHRICRITIATSYLLSALVAGGGGGAQMRNHEIEGMSRRQRKYVFFHCFPSEVSLE